MYINLRSYIRLGVFVPETVGIVFLVANLSACGGCEYLHGFFINQTILASEVLLHT